MAVSFGELIVQEGRRPLRGRAASSLFMQAEHSYLTGMNLSICLWYGVDYVSLTSRDVFGPLVCWVSAGSAGPRFLDHV